MGPMRANGVDVEGCEFLCLICGGGVTILLVMHNDDFFQNNGLGDYLSSVFDDLPDFLYFVKDVDLRLVAFNERLSQKIDIEDKRSILGMTDYDYLPKHMADAYKEDDLWVLEHGKSIQGKVELVTCGKGLVAWSKTTKSPLRNREGQIVGIIGVISPFEQGINGAGAQEVLVEALAMMHGSFREYIPMKKLADVSNMSIGSFVRMFREIYEMTPKEYMRHLRVQEACQKLAKSTKSLAEVGLECGYSSQNYFSREFSRVMKESPTQYRKRIMT